MQLPTDLLYEIGLFLPIFEYCRYCEKLQLPVKLQLYEKVYQLTQKQLYDEFKENGSDIVEIFDFYADIIKTPYWINILLKCLDVDAINIFKKYYKKVNNILNDIKFQLKVVLTYSNLC